MTPNSYTNSNICYSLHLIAFWIHKINIKYAITLNNFIFHIFYLFFFFIYAGKTRTKDKYRIVYSEYQKVELEKEYLYSKYITIQRKAELARSIGLSERQVKIWFQNRRAKERKQKRKREDAIASVHSPEHHSDMKDIEPIKVEPSQEYIPTVNPQMHMHHHLSSPV